MFSVMWNEIIKCMFLWSSLGLTQTNLEACCCRFCWQWKACLERAVNMAWEQRRLYWWLKRAVQMFTVLPALTSGRETDLIWFLDANSLTAVQAACSRGHRTVCRGSGLSYWWCDFIWILCLYRSSNWNPTFKATAYYLFSFQSLYIWLSGIRKTWANCGVFVQLLNLCNSCWCCCITFLFSTWCIQMYITSNLRDKTCVYLEWV